MSNCDITTQLFATPPPLVLTPAASRAVDGADEDGNTCFQLTDPSSAGSRPLGQQRQKPTDQGTKQQIHQRTGRRVRHNPRHQRTRRRTDCAHVTTDITAEQRMIALPGRIIILT